MSPNGTNPRKVVVSIALALMFIFADLALPEAIPEWKQDVLEEVDIIQKTTSNISVSKDTAIDSSNPTGNYGSDTEVGFGGNSSSESRILIEFNNTVPSGDKVLSAVLELTCGINQNDLDSITIYPTRLKQSWSESNATWQSSDNGVNWNEPGADGGQDREIWSVPTYGYGNQTFSINVTEYAQDAIINSRSTINLLITALGPIYQCSMSEATTNQPSLEIVHQTGTHTSGGSMSPTFVENGSALMDSTEFALTADLHPAVSWDSASGNGAQVQFSLYDSFKGNEEAWYFNSDDNNTLFTIGASSGTMLVPQSNPFSNGSTMNYRMRAIDSSGTIGDWQTGNFHLPNHDISLSNGLATFTVNYSSLQLMENSIEDAYVDSLGGLSNTNYGSDGNITVGSHSTSQQYGLIRLNLDDIGMHQNSSIQSATLSFERNANLDGADVSFHIMENNDWTESGVTWKKYDGSNAWKDGGRVTSMSVGNFTGNQSSSTIEVNLTVAIQYWIDNYAAALAAGETPESSIELMLVASSWMEDVSSSTSVKLCSNEGFECEAPELQITYDWDSTGSPVIPTQNLPLDGHGVWNVSNDNLSANTMPSLEWDGSISWTGDMILEVASDVEFRDVIHSFNTASTTEFSETDGNWTFDSNQALNDGVMYHWRVAQQDSTTNHHSWWNASSFLVSSLESEYIQNDERRMRLSHGNATTLKDAPNCEDTYIDSGDPNTNYNDEYEMSISYNTFPAETSYLMGCDLTSHLLPSGYAVKTATFKFRLSSNPSGNPSIGVWESNQHNWTEESATWAKYDGVNAWGTSGAKGWERSSLLDTVNIGNSYSSGDWVEFDVTLAVQNAMREGRQVDMIFSMIGSGTGNNRDIFFFGNNINSANRPEISFVYVPGSNAIPDTPMPQTPLNGSWAVDSGINPAPDTKPELGWNYSTTGTSVGGWSVELDTSPTFDSPGLIMATSWTDTGFDVNNSTYDVQTDLQTGKTWYWRVRATSVTNQIGNWSSVYNFLLPDLTTWAIDSNTTAIELHHREAMPSLNLPNFIDSWVSNVGVGNTSSQFTSTSMMVGSSGSNAGELATGLMKIPLTELPNPQNAHIKNVTLNLYSQTSSDSDNFVSIHPATVAWNSSANGMTYDGVNNWSLPGANGVGDRGYIADIQQSKIADWMTFDVTEIVQQALANGDSHMSIMLVGTDGEGPTYFSSSDGASSERPWINMTWATGNATAPQTAGNNNMPMNNEIVWNVSSHALLPNITPTFTWNHSSSSIDDWRLYIWNDYSDQRQGWTVYDSRFSTEGWDLTNNSWTPQFNLSDAETYKWFVQPITDDILGARGAETIFHVPKETGNLINSTDADISLQEGQIVPSMSYPAIFMDSFIDSGTSNTMFESSTILSMGRSTATTSTNHYSQLLIQVDWSNLPIPGSFEFTEAHLSLYRLSGGLNNQENVTVGICEVMDDWNENVSFNSPRGAGTSWPTDRCDVPFASKVISYNDASIDFDITYAVQHAHASGADMVNLMFFIATTTSDSWQFASSDYTLDESRRPNLELTWRTGNQWLPSAPTGLLPLDGSTLWNETASGLTGADGTTYNWTSAESNETRWIAEISTDKTFTNESLKQLLDLSNSSTFNGTWDYGNLSYTVDDLVANDGWIYWRVRAEQDHRLGKWSDVNSYRVPKTVGVDDGNGNVTVNLFQGAVFIESGNLPNVPDATIDSNQASTNLESDGYLTLGISSTGTGESRILIDFDLSELPFPAAMTPTNALLSLERFNVTGTSALTVSAHACDSFTETATTWNNSPSCSSSEITRSTILVSQSTTQVWDITSLAQSNIANGNSTLTIMLKAVGTPGSTHKFYDNSASDISNRPNLTLEYVDNTAGIIPPGQPTLTYPDDGAVLYNNTEWVLTSMDKPQLTWNSVTNATGYVVTFSDGSNQYRYASATSPEISGTTFTFSDNLTTGTVYTWWVQALNNSIPGPSSSRRTFALGNPVDHFDNGDNTWTYTFQTGNEVPEFGHTNIRDSYLGSGSPSTNHGSDLIVVGTDCENPGTECRGVIALDNSQVPLPLAANIHSVSVELQVETAPQSGFNLNVHRLLTSAWNQAGSTWDSSSSGNPWSAGGMAAGVEYDATPISTTYVSQSTTEITLEIGYEGMLMDGDHGWIIIGSGYGGSPSFVKFYSSESAQSLKPKISLNYTDVDDILISPVAQSTDADTNVQFSHILQDVLGANIAGQVEWSASNGAIDSAGIYTPELVGTHNVTACFGVICRSTTISVTPGLPVLLVVSDTEETITADESFEIVAHVQDQHGNIVSGQAISYTPTNGTMAGAIFQPYETGIQTVEVEWNGQTIDVEITVDGGAPVYYMTTGCESIIKAGTTCTLVWTLHDQYGNILDLADGGGITWNAGGGIFTESNGTYFATTVGSYNITMQSTQGINYTIPVTVEHGEMASLEIIASSNSVTADDIVWLNTTRIDIMGNRLPVLIPLANWTTSDGMIYEGQPAEWHAQRRGNKSITASYAGMDTTVNVLVSEGAITDLILIIDSVDSTGDLIEMTADEEITVKVKARDYDENKWTVQVAWSVLHTQYNDQSVLMDLTYGSQTRFSPVYASDSLYTLVGTYSDENVTLEANITISVDHGLLLEIDFLSPTTSTPNIDADDELTFIPKLTDADENEIDPARLTYTLWKVDDGELTEPENITSIIVGNGGVWEATTVGEWAISAWNISKNPITNAPYNITETVYITVGNGKAVTVDIDVVADTAKAGDVYPITITGTDDDGNQFLESVIWTKDNKGVPQSTISGTGGYYNFSATTAGVHTFKYRSPSGAESEWTVTVSPHQTVAVINLTILESNVPQLESFRIEVKTYDGWENQIPVPPETVVKLTGRMTAEREGQTGNWTITTLDDGEQSVTIAVHNKEETGKIMVDGTFLGFFEAGGTLYYAGGVLAILVMIVLLVVIIMVLRSGESDYDDDDDEYDDDEEEEEQASRPTAGPSGPPPTIVEPQREDWMSDLRMDDDGTAWAEDQNGNWYYQEPGSNDWESWDD
ncbi:MAG: hypothetical protein CMB20_002300 [Methanobacteriota archaeon]|nr:MAG: hypothetical protein CMB20_002300 [Euryarchaeota archaeon]